MSIAATVGGTAVPAPEDELGWLEEWTDELVAVQRQQMPMSTEKFETTSTIPFEALQEAHAKILRRVLDRPNKHAHDWRVLRQTLINFRMLGAPMSTRRTALEVFELDLGDKLSSAEYGAIRSAFIWLRNLDDVAVRSTQHWFWRNQTLTGFEDPENFQETCGDPYTLLRTAAIANVAYDLQPNKAISVLTNLDESLPPSRCKDYLAILLDIARERKAGTYVQPIP